MSKATTALETHGHGPEVIIGSDRSFGLVFAAVFAIVALLPLRHGEEPRIWAAAAATVFLGFALVRPGLLRPLNLAWFRFGLLLHKVVTPVVMGLLFFGVITPIAAAMRLSGKDPLRMRRDPAAASYWLRRDPASAAGSMKNQF